MDRIVSPDSLQKSIASIQIILKESGISAKNETIFLLLRDMQQTNPAMLHSIAEVLRYFGCMVQEEASLPAKVSEEEYICVLLESGAIARIKAVNTTQLRLLNLTTGKEEYLAIESLPRDRDIPVALTLRGSARSFLTSKENEASVRNHDYHEHEYQHLSAGKILRKLWRLLRQEKKDVAVVVSYSVIMGLLSLVVPLSSQAIVNAVALGIYTSQLVVLCVGVGIGLLMLGIINVMEMYVVDVLRRRIFVRTAFEIAYRLPRIKAKALEGEYAPELVNRFFDVITVTKSLGKFLLDGVSALLVALIGLILLAVYHPFFLLFDIFLIVFIVLLVLVLGRGGLRTSIQESKKKYAVANWLEEIARCQQAFKLNADSSFAYHRLDAIAEQYVGAHHSHFLVIARQVAGSSLFRSVATVGVLGVGGMLVIERQLSLGQLIAAELVVITLLGSIEKLITQFEDFYDLLTGLDKLSSITDKEVEEIGGENPDFGESAIDLRVRGVSFTYPNNNTVLNDLSLRIPAGTRISLVGENGSGKTTFAELLMGLHVPDKGSVEFNGYDIQRISLTALRRIIGTVSRENDVFDGTIEENITMGRSVPYHQLQHAISVAGMDDDLPTLKKGLATRVVSSGLNLPYGLVRRIILARCILCHPRFIILDEAFDGVERATKLAIIERLYAEKNCTILDISHDEDLVRRADCVLTIKDGRIIEQGTLKELGTKADSEFRKLFPDITVY